MSLIQQIFAKLITRATYVSTNKQRIAFPNYFGALSWLCQGKGEKVFSHFKCLRGQTITRKLLHERVWSGYDASISQWTTNKNMSNNIILISTPDFHRLLLSHISSPQFCKHFSFPHVLRIPALHIRLYFTILAILNLYVDSVLRMPSFSDVLDPADNLWLTWQIKKACCWPLLSEWSLVSNLLKVSESSKGFKNSNSLLSNTFYSQFTR
jgi:hypothetical protein